MIVVWLTSCSVLNSITETFLFYLIESFKFTPGKSDIVWNTSSIVFPSVSKESSKAEMPLRVELIRPGPGEVMG